MKTIKQTRIIFYARQTGMSVPRTLHFAQTAAVKILKAHTGVLATRGTKLDLMEEDV